MKLTAKRVSAIFLECLFVTDEDTSNHVRVDGILHSVGFHPGRLEAHRTEIEELLNELPAEFQEGAGGGSFLKARNNKHGQPWTNLPQTMDELFQLGMGIGRVERSLAREPWIILPNGMPYYIIKHRPTIPSQNPA